jgi:hypothetical protein
MSSQYKHYDGKKNHITQYIKAKQECQFNGAPTFTNDSFTNTCTGNLGTRSAFDKMFINHYEKNKLFNMPTVGQKKN